jgi:hypothetical protein
MSAYPPPPGERAGEAAQEAARRLNTRVERRPAYAAVRPRGPVR